jgi:hypothetical protein
MPVGWVLVSSRAFTPSPVRVVVAAIDSRMTSWLVSGRPRQFMVMWERSRPFTLPGRLVTVLHPVVQILRLPVLDAGHGLAVGRAVGAEPVGDDHPRDRTGVFQQAAEESAGRGGVAPVLYEDVEHRPVLVDSAPQVLLLTVDLDEDLVQMPLAPGPGPAAPHLAGVGRAELHTPAADRLVGDDDTALEHELLDLAERQRKAVVQPYQWEMTSAG